jgi:endonuclease/exonuclease/phosphatase family metal-dependent hydrolase
MLEVRLRKKVEITEHSITFHRGKHSFSGCTLHQRPLIPILSHHFSTEHSTVILGDINTRFKDPFYQAGEPGPPERLQVFNNFIASTDHQHIKPIQTAQKPTTDHCFVRPRQTCTLQLPDNATLKMETDHRYTLSLILGLGGAHEVPAERCLRNHC